jgi:hypothetical protein
MGKIAVRISWRRECDRVRTVADAAGVEQAEQEGEVAYP